MKYLQEVLYDHDNKFKLLQYTQVAKNKYLRNRGHENNKKTY